MDKSKEMCAPENMVLNNTKRWQQVDRRKAEDYVRKLQARIVKAQREGRYSKVKSLQWLLTHSFYGRYLAVVRVTTNKGKNTAGVDGVKWSTDAAKAKAINTLKRRGYKPMPLNRVEIPKKNGKKRPLGIPTMKDRAMQALYLMALDPIAETTGDQHSYGFRKYRRCQDAIADCHNLLSKKVSPKWILEGDIKGCFDHISHEWLLNNIPMDKEMLRKWLKCGYVFKGEVFPTEEGTPQGGIISPTLANMVLDGLQSLVTNAVQTYTIRTEDGERKWIKPKIHLVRYADDFIVTAKDKETIETILLPLIKQFMAERGLTLSDEKTKITHVSEGFDFLGFNLREYPDGKFLTKPSKDAMKNICDKMRAKVKSNKSAKTISIIRMLNPMLTGWSNYYRYGASSRAFSRVDFEVYRMLWRWAKRRHPKKSRHWIKENYFKTIHGSNWRFAAIQKKKSGRERTFCLKNLSDVAIQKYIPIKISTNPYDPADAAYYTRRKSHTTEVMFRQTDELLRMIWLHQGKRCPICGEIIDDERRWTTIQKTVDGKPFEILIHRECKPKMSNPNKISRK